MTYLCYDIKGIQTFIFAVPRLKHIVGGSVMIDQFDRDTIPGLRVNGATNLFAGGGKGCFRCDDSSTADLVQAKIVSAAHAVGLGVAVGQSADYSEAAQCADRFFPCLPEPNELDGHPCPESGLYPVATGRDTGRAHRLIQNRVIQRGNLLRRRLEDRLLDNLDILQIKAQSTAGNVEFFHDISEETDEGLCAIDALGARGRWAVICMDGNDIGLQFRKFQETQPSEAEMQEWVKEMSQSLDRCSSYAAKRGCEVVLRKWASDSEHVEDATTEDGVVILPIRPIVVGGDDLAVLSHAQYAFDFVEEACRAFQEQSIIETKGSKGLWPATDGQLTLSAGVLFCPIPLPLHMAIPYAETLLASAKGEGRKHAINGKPSPACIDYETVTESMLDTVTDRRNRELRFIDGDEDVLIELTQKPYSLDDFKELRRHAIELENVPRSIRHDLLSRLRAGAADRVTFRAQVAKRSSELNQRLDENTWTIATCRKTGKTIRSTSLVDQVEILEEMHRSLQKDEF
ncbi:MAG: hypothetical protein O2856_07740 [Planctomycetota bacterium]|nr:hypothetical protein [Planctomycetota bacterium]